MGPEICIKTMKFLHALQSVKIIPVGNFKILCKAARLFEYSSPLVKLSSIEEARDFLSNNEVLNIELEDEIKTGKVSSESGRHTYNILKTCSTLCLQGKTTGIVTCPINKEALQLAGYNGEGHTEILKNLAYVPWVETVFCIEKLKIFFLSRHVSLQKAISLITKDTVLSALIKMDNCMKDMGYQEPRLGLPGLNPHCGDGGLFGKEEIEELIPAVMEARKKGINVKGPVGADSIYHLGIQGEFDAILSLYHDQGHIASKTYNFYKTVTITLGLPYIRTSVDHGTGYDIAWKGVANPESLIRATSIAMDLIEKNEGFSPCCHTEKKW
ncbi:MAG: 4-hydroxythreonine-4-phosphate dehydrogenase 2 [bacterium ADurb.Bin363]|nr:MAG: 4-hydroxythreonine-4-phosphate dehydrogenase 2 [bacterium ADurb.Bin363]